MLNKKIKANAISNNISFQWNSEQSIPVYGLQAISKINDKIFGVIIKDNIIGFYTIDKENNLILLADYEQDRAYPIENGSGIAFTNEEDNKKWDKKIYYQFLISDGKNTAQTQFFILDLSDEAKPEVSATTVYRLTGSNNPFLNNYNNRHVYLYEHYIIVTHSAMWEKSSVAIILDLKEDNVTIKQSADDNLYMTFNEKSGYLYFVDNYKQFTAYKVNNKNTLTLKNKSDLIFSKMFTNGSNSYVISKNKNNDYTIEQIFITSLDDIVTLFPVIKDSKAAIILDAYKIKNNFYFYGINYNTETSIKTAFIYKLIIKEKQFRRNRKI
ncbi:hypothetical protein [Spiroplasma endosymbiont of Tiphia femorata]|uniref:hypothetical protein n=1 Tax=Spiroplasma endosymbiont of Tiphia femorata TaxID=3066326 RepID=UPI0030D03500